MSCSSPEDRRDGINSLRETVYLFLDASPGLWGAMSLANTVPSRPWWARSFASCSWKSSAVTLHKEIRRYNSRSATCSRMNHKAGINGHTWHSFAVVLVKVDDVPIAVLLATEKFPFLSFFRPSRASSCGSAPSYAEACTNETGRIIRSFRIIGCSYSRLESSLVGTVNFSQRHCANGTFL